MAQICEPRRVSGRVIVRVESATGGAYPRPLRPAAHYCGTVSRVTTRLRSSREKCCTDVRGVEAVARPIRGRGQGGHSISGRGGGGRFPVATTQ